jgi:mono/diheme cytochrome c family protein
MTKTVARSLFVLAAAAAAGCSVKSVETTPPTTGAAGSSPVVAGPPAACTSSMNAGGGAAVRPTPPGFASPFTPQVGATHSSTEPPPAISGGTLRVLKDGVTAVAADPDRDSVYIVDLTKRALTATVQLQKGDEPGRVAADAAGHVHVALRRGGAIVSIDPATGNILDRRAVCGAPRGVAYDPNGDLLHVACADGELVSLPAAGGPATRTVQLEPDLRDVVVQGKDLRVSRFKSAQLLTVPAQGAMPAGDLPRLSLPSYKAVSVRNGQTFTPSVAWRTVETPSGGVAVLHERGFAQPIEPAFGGYGGFNPCEAIVQTAVTVVEPGQKPRSGPAMSGLVLAVDMAISADGNKVAIVAPGNATNSESEGGPPRMPRVFVTDMQSATDPAETCKSDGIHGPCLPAGMGGFFPQGVSTGAAGSVGAADVAPPSADGGVSDPSTTPTAPSFPSTCGTVDGANPTDPSVPQVVGEPVAVAYAGDKVIIQSREPAVLAVPGGAPITLSTESRSDTGHSLFHANAGGMIACASCHPEGNEDGRVWNFACEGPRRTQSLQVGLKGTEPFHWGGDEKDFSMLVSDVFQGRMSGPQLASDQVTATLGWIDGQPRRTRTLPKDSTAVSRGKALFEDSKGAACATCHTGPGLTNNQTVDVGTGGTFQVPSLVGISTRGPFMHNGCAKTLKDRFGACGGGDKHGVTSKLTPAQIDDMVAYLQTL